MVVEPGEHSGRDHAAVVGRPTPDHGVEVRDHRCCVRSPQGAHVSSESFPEPLDVGRRVETVGLAFALEVDALAPLPTGPFATFAELSAKVDTKARISVRQAHYSVPAGMARKRVAVRLHADRVEVIAGGRVVASHARSLHKGTETLVLDHYLEVLGRKPSALAGSVALAQARAAGTFTATHQRFWDEARRRLGDGAGTRALCKVLLLHRDLPAGVVEAGIDAALGVDSVDPNAVKIECRGSFPTGAPRQSQTHLSSTPLCWPNAAPISTRMPTSWTPPVTGWWLAKGSPVSETS